MRRMHNPSLQVLGMWNSTPAAVLTSPQDQVIMRANSKSVAGGFSAGLVERLTLKNLVYEKRLMDPCGRCWLLL